MRDDEPSDEQLLRRVARGDRVAFDELYQRNAGWLTLRLRRRCAESELVAEVLQDCFLTVWRSAGGFGKQGKATGWLWSIASSRLIDAYRRRGARVQTSGPFPESALTSRSAEAEVMNGTFSAEMADALDRLAPEL